MDFREVIRELRNQTKEGRELTYSDGEVGITTLLSCPLKVELRKKHPEITASAVEIDDGYVWEQQVKGALRKLYGDRFKEEYELTHEIDGLKIRGHLDCMVETDDAVIGIELKAPKMLILREFPPDEELIDGVFLIDEEGKYVIHNPYYLLQARIQKFILKQHFPDKEVSQYLFYKAPVRRGRFEKKLYVLAPVAEEVSREELNEIVRKFREDPSPRYPNECTSYCEFYRAGVCEGREFRYEDRDASALDEETKKLIREYRELQSQMKTLESLLKKKIKGVIRFGNKEIGWVKKETLILDDSRVLSMLSPEEVSQYYLPRWNKKGELVERFGEEIVLERKEERVWRV